MQKKLKVLGLMVLLATAAPLSKAHAVVEVTNTQKALASATDKVNTVAAGVNAASSTANSLSKLDYSKLLDSNTSYHGGVTAGLIRASQASSSGGLSGGLLGSGGGLGSLGSFGNLLGSVSGFGNTLSGLGSAFTSGGNFLGSITNLTQSASTIAAMTGNRNLANTLGMVGTGATAINNLPMAANNFATNLNTTFSTAGTGFQNSFQQMGITGSTATTVAPIAAPTSAMDRVAPVSQPITLPDVTKA